MAIFGQTTSLYNGNIPTYEGYDTDVNGGIDAIIESFDDQLAVIEAMHKFDMIECDYARKIKMLRESGNDSEDEIEELEQDMETAKEGVLGDIWSKIVEGLKKLWGKIVAFFKSIQRFFIGLFASAKDFVKKYKEELLSLERSGKLSGYSKEMYTYTVSSSIVDKGIKQCSDFCNDIISDLDEQVLEKEILDENPQLKLSSGSGSSSSRDDDDDDGPRLGAGPDRPRLGSGPDRPRLGSGPDRPRLGSGGRPGVIELPASSYSVESWSRLYEAASDKERDVDTERSRLAKILIGDDDAENYTSNLTKFFRNGDDSKSEVKIKISTIIKDIEELSNLVPSMKKAESDMNNVFNKAVGRTEKLRKDVERGKESSEYSAKYANKARKIVEVFRAAQNMGIQFVQAAKNAANEALVEYKSVCTGAFGYARNHN